MNYYDPNAQPGQPWQSGQPQPNQGQFPYAPPPWYQPGQSWPPGPSYVPPQPQPPKRKLRLWVWILAGIAALMFCSVAGHATQSSTTQTAIPTEAPTPTPTQDPSQSPAYQMAGIDNGTTTPGDATVAKYQAVLDDLHRKTSDSELDIANETVAGQQILAKRGQGISLYALASAVDKGIPPGTPKRPYAESLAAITTLMSSGNQ